MKNKLATLAAIAALIAGMLIVGGIDNDNEEQHNSPRTGCHQVTTPDGSGFCY